MNKREIVEHSILLRNGDRVVVPCYVTKVHGTDELIFEPVDKARYREDTRIDDRERTYLLPGEGVAASEQDWSPRGGRLAGIAPAWEMVFARIFGTRYVQINEGMTIEYYVWRGRMYIVDVTGSYDDPVV